MVADAKAQIGEISQAATPPPRRGGAVVLARRRAQRGADRSPGFQEFGLRHIEPAASRR
jgi:hypothetical protein